MIYALVWVTAMLGRVATGKNTPPAVERERAVGEIENGLVCSTGLVVELLLVELLLSSSMVKLVLGEGERRLGEREGDPRDTRPDDVGDAAEL